MTMDRRPYTAAELIVVGEAWIAADEARMARRPKGFPRFAWAIAHPVPDTVPRVGLLIDTSFKSRPTRTARVVGYGQYFSLVIEGERRPDVIRLTDPDADARLTRYERLES